MARGIRRNGRPVSARPRRFPLPLARVGGDPASRGDKARIGRPRQEALRDAADPSARERAPIGLGLDSQTVRARMVQRLRDEGMSCEPVLNALASVPRHEFVDSALAAQAYEDTSLPIGLGQTISKPSVVARMLALLFEGRVAVASGSLGRVLEIGTGCGYQAALLALLARQVISVERLRPLHERARDNLAALRRNNLRLVYGDGRLGHAPNAPYDAIICAAGGDEVPSAWLEQMAIGARLVAPTRGEMQAGQVLLVIDRTVDGWSRRCHEAVHFVPLRSGTA
jgi:protein-L-isoaspartate(D-aspartate) O-methyltransferase